MLLASTEICSNWQPGLWSRNSNVRPCNKYTTYWKRLPRWVAINTNKQAYNKQFSLQINRLLALQKKPERNPKLTPEISPTVINGQRQSDKSFYFVLATTTPQVAKLGDWDRATWNAFQLLYVFRRVTEPLSKWGGTSARQKTIENFCALNCQLWRHKHWNMMSLLIHNMKVWIIRPHYFRQNYITMKTYRWTTWNSNRLLQGRPRTTASLGLIIR